MSVSNAYAEDLLLRLRLSETCLLGCVMNGTDYRPSADYGEWEVAHNVGRVIEAILLMEQYCGTKPDEKAVAGLVENLWKMTDNPFSLLLWDNTHFHSMREALMAYAALIKYRPAYKEKALEKAKLLIKTMTAVFYDKTLTSAEISTAMGFALPGPAPADDPYYVSETCQSTGRAIEGLFRLWELTGDSEVLTALQQNVAHHRVNALCPDGSAPAWMTCPTHVGHNHSTLGTLRGLLLYGLKFGDAALVDAVWKTWQKTIFTCNCDETGFAPHDLGKARFNDRLGDPLGDQASCCDVCYIGWLLATEAGHSEILDTVEKLIRTRLFHFQRLDDPKYLGAWGITGAYDGGGTTIDVFALIESTLAMMYGHNIAEKDGVRTLNLLFSCESNSLKVDVTQDDCRRITLTSRTAAAIRFRVPAWVDRTQIDVRTADGKKIACGTDGCFAVIPADAVAVNSPITVTLPLPVTEKTVYAWRSKTPYRVTWKGDSVVSFTRID